MEINPLTQVNIGFFTSDLAEKKNNTSLAGQARTIQLPLTEQEEEISFFVGADLSEDENRKIGKALAACRKDASEENVANLRKCTRQFSILERKDSITSIDGDVTELKETCKIIETEEDRKKAYLSIRYSLYMIRRNPMLEYVAKPLPSELVKYKKEEEVEEFKKLLTRFEKDFITENHEYLARGEKKLRFKDELCLTTYTLSSSDYINNYLEDKAARTTRYENLSTEIRNSYELICDSLNDTINFLRDNSRRTQEVSELHRVTVLSNDKIAEIEKTGFYQINRFLSTSRGITNIISNNQLLNPKNGWRDKSEVLFRIHTTGKVDVDISQYSLVKQEKEHLIPPGNKLEFIRGSKKRNGRFIEMSFNLIEN